MPLDVAAIQPDFIVSVGYKWLLGPLGLGCLYVAERHRDGEPLEENWINRAGSEDFARLVDYRDEYRDGARRYDVASEPASGSCPWPAPRSSSCWNGPSLPSPTASTPSPARSRGAPTSSASTCPP